ncbi:MAG: alkaline phosphatase family protein [Planctomycetes bacterium]|nr:alkaline phosphatase family protein [Planctomycetota bacterium]
MKRVCVINVVGLTEELLVHAPNLRALGQAKPWRAPLPAVTCTAQATMLTGCSPKKHGIVANGWCYPETQEVRFWQQSYQLLEAEPFYCNRKTASLFWWFALGAPIESRVLPRPHYGCDGSKAFDIIDTTSCALQENLGPFPFFSFWGPNAGLPSSTWIAEASALVMRKEKPEITLVYLPHLDYDYQRFGPGNVDRVKEVDECAAKVVAAAQDINAEVIVVSEYGLVDVDQPVYLNRELRKQGWLNVRPGPFGERLQPQSSHAFAVCDHQLAHLYVRGLKLDELAAYVENIPGVSRVCRPEELALNHRRSGDLIVLSEQNAWFAYPYWLENQSQPDFHATIDIHNKPGYDPCELFLGSKAKLFWRLLQKKCGLRVPMDIINTDAKQVRGSHGLNVEPSKGPLIIGQGAPDNMLGFKEYILSRLG